MDQFQERHIDTKRGFHYRYYVSSPAADKQKPVLLLCHGWPDSAVLWKDVAPYLLKSGLQIVIPDLLGYGGSSKPTDPKEFEIRAMVTDVMEIFTQGEFSDSKIIPVGHDWGSYFAQRFYLLNKSRMAGLITLNVAFMLPRADKFDLEQFNAFTEQQIGYPLYAYWELFADPEGPREVMDQYIESVWYAAHGESNDWMKQLFCTRGAMRDWVSKGRKDVPLKKYAQDAEFKRAWMEEMTKGGFTAPGCWYRAMKENYHVETEATLDAKVETPYLFIGADGDAVCRTDFIEGVKQAGVVKDLEVHELHSGHWTPFEQPDEIGRIVLQWLTKKNLM